MNPLIGLIIVIVIISAVVGAIAQFLNKLGEMNAPNRRADRAAAGPRAEPAAAPRQADRDMDRFLAEIDRLRRKNADAGQQQSSGSATPVVPVARPVSRPTDRPRPRVVAELAETQPQQQRPGTDAQGFTTPPSAPPSPIVP